jgi:hypothetical protein
MFCHQYPTKTCGRDTPTPGCPDGMKLLGQCSLTKRWCTTRESVCTTASPKAVGS